MKVILADTLGFCKGVETAVNLIYKEIENTGGENVLMEGPIIHNRLVVEDLNNKGVKLLKDDFNPTDVKGKKVVIRAHGISPLLEEKIQSFGGVVIDGTCAIVKTSQKKIKEYVRLGYFIVVTGDKGHPEVVGLVGQAPEKILVITKTDDIDGFNFPEKTLLISQTTFSKKEFYKIEEKLKEKCPTLTSICSICGATNRRQTAVTKLVSQIDALVVVGGLTSSNTLRLKKAGEEHVPTYLVESYMDIPEEIRKYKIVGVAAGASTPSNLIKEVVNYLESI